MAHRSGIFVVVLSLALSAACDRPADERPIATSAPAPTTVSCGDAAQLRQRALDERLQHVDATSDQQKVLAGSRASFYMSLANIADLKCKGTSAEADAMLEKALTSARGADGAASFYEAAIGWTEAGVAASEAVSMLIESLGLWA